VRGRNGQLQVQPIEGAFIRLNVGRFRYRVSAARTVARWAGWVGRASIMATTDPAALLRLIENNPTASPAEIEDAWNEMIKADEILEAVVSSPADPLGSRSMEEILRAIPRKGGLTKKLGPIEKRIQILAMLLRSISMPITPCSSKSMAAIKAGALDATARPV
jgi:hypothetical protein